MEAVQSWKDLENEHRLFQNLLRLLQIVRADNAEEELKASLSVFDEAYSAPLRGSDNITGSRRRKETPIEHRARGTGPKSNRLPWVSTSGLRGMC